METKLTFGEEIAVASAICLRILELSYSIQDCRTLGHDADVLLTAKSALKSAYKKITGTDFDSVYHE